MRFVATLLYLIAFMIVESWLQLNGAMIVINVVLLLTVGLAHGSNDLQLYALAHDRPVVATTLIYYATAITLTLLLYWVSPAICLLGYLLLSSYHFGEELLSDRRFPPHTDKFLATMLGLLVFLLMFSLNYLELNLALDVLVGITISKVIIYTATFCFLLATAAYWWRWQKDSPATAAMGLPPYSNSGHSFHRIFSDRPTHLFYAILCVLAQLAIHAQPGRKAIWRG